MTEATHARFLRLSESTGRPMTQLLDEAVDSLERRLFFDRLDQGFRRLRDEPETWTEIEAEREAESTSLRDSSA